VALEWERMNLLNTRFFPEAVAGNHASAAIALKISERRGQLLGLDRAHPRARRRSGVPRLKPSWRRNAL
jgi:hypothetical protein